VPIASINPNDELNAAGGSWRLPIRSIIPTMSFATLFVQGRIAGLCR
jgi:hypothetical protein